MKDYVIEKQFEYNGFLCAVLMQKLGHRCGYVGIPKGHKLYGRKDLEKTIDVHGGITYSSWKRTDGYPIDKPNDYHWIGWDYAHYGDCADADDYIKNFGQEEYFRRIKYGGGYIFATDGWTYSVEDERAACEYVVEQLEIL